ncbi:MAG: nucleoside deaminase [Gammaproteobacteria bacterium]|nr:nucleoside deaminase [Gammaproteobacteria bacterium]MDH5776677.1 nucleoside deaminase [Gammaproteobacteria bacterium]
MTSQATSIEFTLPLWLHEYMQSCESIISLDDRMAFVIKAAERNVIEGTGGPFAAAIFESDSGKLISLGVNLVTAEQASILHAEMVAITLAQKKLGTYDLGGAGLQQHELVSSTEPCAMCFGAIPWSGLRRVVTGARDEDARQIGFDEGPKPEDWRSELSRRQIEVVTDINRDEARQVLINYRSQGGKIYNSREAG